LPDLSLVRRQFLSLLPGLLPAAKAAASPRSTGVWLQNVDAEHATLFWLDPSGRRAERKRVTGLEPATEYSFDLEAGAAKFRTARRDGVVRLLAFGDSGSQDPQQKILADRMEQETVDLVLHTGDLAYPAGAHEDLVNGYLAVYRAMMSRLPFFAAPGNHDYATEDAAPFLALHEAPECRVPEKDRGRYYSFDWGGVHFISLDSNRPLLDAVEGKGEMLRWLEQDLQRASGAFFKIAFFHHPPYAGGPNQEHVMTQLARRHLAPILERHGVQLVLTSHEHSYQRSHPIRNGARVEAGHGAVYVTSGGGGAMLYPVYPMEQVALGVSAHHYLRLEISGAKLKLEAVGIDGDILDTIELAPRPEMYDGGLKSVAGDPGRIAAGGMVSLFGRNLACGGGSLKLSVNGRPAVVLYASPVQINAALPPDVRGRALLRLETENGVAETVLELVDAAPGILAVAHLDGELVSAAKPGRAGGRILALAAGLGAGKPEAFFESNAAQVVAAGMDPRIPGLQRVEITVPSMAAGSHQLRLRSGGFSSNAVAVAVSGP